MNRVTMSGDDGFWARVRSVLGRNGGAETGMLGTPMRKSRPAQPIDEALRRGWSEAAQRHVSLCVLAMEMDGFNDYLNAYGHDVVEESLALLQRAISAILPRADQQCLRSGRSGLVIVLADMPGLMARELAAKIAVAVRREGLPHRESHAGHITLSMGLAVVNPQHEFDRAVLSGATQAVKKAQRRGIGRLEILDLRGQDEKRRKAA